MALDNLFSAAISRVAIVDMEAVVKIPDVNDSKECRSRRYWMKDAGGSWIGEAITDRA